MKDFWVPKAQTNQFAKLAIKENENDNYNWLILQQCNESKGEGMLVHVSMRTKKQTREKHS